MYAIINKVIVPNSVREKIRIFQKEITVENLVLLSVFVCGVIAGGSAKINPHGVPQRGPNTFWAGIAAAISLIALVGGIDTPPIEFLLLSGIVFLLSILAGIPFAWMCRGNNPLISD